MTMNYDVQIGNTIRRGLSYAELVVLPIEPDTFVRRGNGDWIQAKNCIELTHVLAQRQTIQSGDTPSVYDSDISEYSNEEYIEEEYNGYDNEEEEDEIIEPQQYTPQYIPQNPVRPRPPVQPDHHHEDVIEERIFIPTAEYFKCKQKRKAAIIGVCTLGLAGLSLMGIGNTWRSNIFAGTSFSANAGIGFVLKCLSFFLLTALIAIPYFIYSVFALIYYSIRLNNLKR